MAAGRPGLGLPLAEFALGFRRGNPRTADCRDFIKLRVVGQMRCCYRHTGARPKTNLRDWLVL